MASSTPSTAATSLRARSRSNAIMTFSRPHIGFHRKSSMMKPVDPSVALDASHRTSKVRHLPVQGIHGLVSVASSAATTVVRATHVTHNPLSRVIHPHRRGFSSAPAAEDIVTASSTAKAAKSTKCTCSVNGEHFKETALECVVPGSPERVHNLMFRDAEFLQTFLKDGQKLLDIELNDWELKESKHTRAFSYLKPLSGPIGPKQTTCHLVDQVVHCDFDDHITVLTTTRTPDVPSGDAFSVVTKTCLTWASAASTRLCVTTETAWTGRSLVKGIINSSCISGQKEYHSALQSAMRSHIEERKDEFLEGLDASAAEDVEIISETTITTTVTKPRFSFDFAFHMSGTVITLVLLILLFLASNYSTFAQLHHRSQPYTSGSANISHNGPLSHAENIHIVLSMHVELDLADGSRRGFSYHSRS